MADLLNNDGDKYIENNEKDEPDSEQLGNPAPPPDVDMNLLRGDRIGDTVYSGKWCIKTVMKLMQSNVIAKSAEGETKTELVDMDEDLQNEVGVLWDMTINVEVCQYLQSVGAIESIYHVIANSRCPRATEMCVGMLANIVSHEELWQCLHSDETLFDILIPLLSHSDQPLLLELSRFFNTALNQKENHCCYDSLWENRLIIFQELVRIFSGSTNGDLLRQVSEFTHILMSLDESDCRFNVLFADADFITAILETSKEFGYKHETQGQVRVMDILHCFTTYEAGITALEPCLEEITRAAMKYLKMLCHSLNLSSSCDVITVILRILNHILCRSVAVRIELMSSSSLIHCILKVLVTVYRRLGMYDRIALAPRRRSTKDDSKTSEDQLSSQLAAVASPSWENLPPEEGKKSQETAASWSERAGLGEATSQAYRTPEASPQQDHQLKESDISWSERRGASPLAKIKSMGNECEWKRPAERKRKLKKRGRKDAAEYEKLDKEEPVEDVEKVRPEKTEGESEEKVTTSGDDVKDGSAELELCDEKEDETKSCANATCGQNVLEPSGQDDQLCGSIEKRLSSTDSSVSGGFEPSLDASSDMAYRGDDEDMECEGKMSDKQQAHQDMEDNIQSTVTHTGGEKTSTADRGLENESAHQEQRETRFLHDEDEDSKDSSSFSVDRYHMLLDVLREFMVDFFDNVGQSLTTDGGVLVIAGAIKFLDTQCSSTYIRALAMCLSPEKHMSDLLRSLLELAVTSKASHLHEVLIRFFHL